MQDFTKLEVWRRALALVIDVDRQARQFPRGGYGWLASQMRRAAASVGANIAEGCGQRTEREFARFLQIAAASVSETRHHLTFARDVGLISAHDQGQLCDELIQLRRTIVALSQRVRKSLIADNSPPTPDSSRSN